MWYFAKIRPILFLILLMTTSIKDSFSQKEAYNWYFGGYAALNFSSGEAVSIDNSAMLTWNGCASLSDTAGNLLFYSNGEEIWNRNHQVMPNGDSLKGNSGATQSAMAVPVPGMTNKYYLFTIGQYDFQSGSGFGCYYSMIDMDLDGGLGNIISDKKNIFLLGSDSALQVIMAVAHANHNDYWLIVRNFSKINSFKSYLIDNSGLHQEPIVSNCIYDRSPLEANGTSKVSPDGKYYLYSISSWVNNNTRTNELYTFDNRVGELTPVFAFSSIPDDPYFTWGAEFSANSEFLYLSIESARFPPLVYHNLIKQFDIGKINNVDIFESSSIVLYTEEIENDFKQMQIAPDGKIYIDQVATGSSNYMSRINFPSQTGALSSFEKNAVELIRGNCSDGLPTFIQSFFVRFNWTGNCLGDETKFKSWFLPVPDSIRWEFGDVGSGLQNTSNILNPIHTFTSNGTYSVKAIAYYSNGHTEESTREVLITAYPSFNLGEDIEVCPGTEVVLNPGLLLGNYLWSNGATSTTINITEPDTYWLRVENTNGCASTDTIMLENYGISSLDETNLIIAPTTCGGSTGAISGLQVIGQAPFLIQWRASGSPLSNSLDIFHLGAGLYELNVTDSFGCTNIVATYAISDAGNILIDTVSATPAYCGNDDGTLHVKAISGLGSMLQYFIKTGANTLSQWHNGDFTGLASGIYYVWVSDSSRCISVYPRIILIDDITASAIDSVSSTPAYCGNRDGTISIAVAQGLGIMLHYFIKTGNDTISQWSSGEFAGLAEGAYSVWVSDSSGCISEYPDIILIDELEVPVVASAASTPESIAGSDGTITVIVTDTGLTYSLNGAAPVSSGYFTGLVAGTYSMTVVNPFGCDTTFSVTVGQMIGYKLSAIAGNGTACLGKVAKAPLLVRNFRHVSAFETTLNYDKLSIICNNYIPDSQLSDSLEVTLYPSTGTIKATWKGASPLTLPDSAQLMQLVFGSLQPGSSNLQWDISPGISHFSDSTGADIQVIYTMGLVFINDPPVINAAPNRICEGDTLILSPTVDKGTGTISYNWETPNGPVADARTIIKANATLQDSGPYTLRVMDTVNCADTAIIYVTVVPTPASGFEADTIYFENERQLVATPGYASYAWNTGETTNAIRVTDEGWYHVNILTPEGCSVTDSTMMLWAFVPISVPNAFSPNGNGLNDRFRAITYPEKITSFSLFVYNQWGGLVYQSTDISSGWDGTYAGMPAPAGMYAYTLTYGNKVGNSRTVRGTVMLVR
jgi:gliding motility-associated-like protein